MDLKGIWEENLPLVVTYNNSYWAGIQMTPYEELHRRPCRSSIYCLEVGERLAIGSNLVKDASEKVDLIQKRLLTA